MTEARNRALWPLPGALLLCVLLSGSGVQAQIKPAFQTEYRLERPTITIPFEYRQNQIVVRGQANDRKDLVFLFDTGASIPVMEKSLGLTGSHIADAQFREAEGITRAQAIWLDDIFLFGEEGAAHVHNIAVFLADLSQISRLLNLKIDGVLGASFMAGYVTEIDYARRVIRLHSQRTYTVMGRKPDNQRTFLFNLKPTNPLQPGGTMTIEGQLHPKYDYEFLLDTGFGGYLSVAHSAAREAGLIDDRTPRVPIVNYSVTRRFQSLKIRASYLTVGAINLSGRVIQVDLRNNDVYGQIGIIGNRMLQNYRITMDFPRLKLWMERVTEKEEPDEAERPTLGLTIRADGRSIRVERVARYSPAQRGGVRPGDAIVAINGVDTATMDLSQVTGLLTTPRGETVLSLQRGVDPNFGTRGAPFTVTLRPASPLDWVAE
ncbi:MAG: PDZ domain-containing protein [Chloroherpetonaceae bacterium]|nr:PDZ domain-containing protein [Chthonomonadaceae bacterium]MDW8206633.1 PDZ domain-containing protein [Chloroherpetonaceae bacterium]